MAIVGCGSGEDNPAPAADQSPSGGLNALEQMKKGGTGPTSGIDNAKAASKAAKAGAAK